MRGRSLRSVCRGRYDSEEAPKDQSQASFTVERINEIERRRHAVIAFTKPRRDIGASARFVHYSLSRVCG